MGNNAKVLSKSKICWWYFLRIKIKANKLERTHDIICRCNDVQKFQFNRLLRMMDDLIENKKIHERVFAQIGNSDYLPQYYEYCNFLSNNDYEEYIKNCDILVSHSGVGTIMTGLRYRRKIIVVPRLSKYGEHIDDHQTQIAQSFSKLNYVLMYSDEDNNMEQLIVDATTKHFSNYSSCRNQVIDTIRQYIDC